MEKDQQDRKIIEDEKSSLMQKFRTSEQKLHKKLEGLQQQLDDQQVLHEGNMIRTIKNHRRQLFEIQENNDMFLLAISEEWVIM